MEGRRNGEDVVIAALVSSMRPMRSRKGDRWAILNLQDMTGELEALVFPEAFARLETLLKSGAPLLLRGRVNVEDAGTRVAIQEGQPLDRVAGTVGATALMRVRIDLSAMDEYTLDQIKAVLRRPPGPCPIAFDLIDPDGTRGHAGVQPESSHRRSAGEPFAGDVRRRPGGSGALIETC